jgi:hypothetical protein
MAQKLHIENQSIPSTVTSVFKSDKKQIIFLNVWNLIRGENIFTINGENVQLTNCGGKTNDAHHVRIIELDVNDEIILNGENFEYNIIY